jgi:hypothetical protein
MSLTSDEYKYFLAGGTLETELSHMSPLITNEQGGKQSNLNRDYTLIPPDALAQVARVLHNGLVKYGKDNWRKVPVEDHLNHSINHVYLHIAGNTNEDHLSHAATRLLMALDLHTCLLYTSPSPRD